MYLVWILYKNSHFFSLWCTRRIIFSIYPPEQIHSIFQKKVFLDDVDEDVRRKWNITWWRITNTLYKDYINNQWLVQFSPNSFMSFFFSLTNNGKELQPIRKHAMHCRLHVKCPTALPVKQKHTNLKNRWYTVTHVSYDSWMVFRTSNKDNIHIFLPWRTQKIIAV